MYAGAGDLAHHRVLGEGGAPHEVIDHLPVQGEARGAIGHHSLPLGAPDLGTEIRLWGLTEYTRRLPALGCITWDNSIAYSNSGDTRTNTFYYPAGFVA